MGVMTHFNHTRLPAWPTLTDSERYWAGYVARKADDMGLVREWYYGTATFFERTDLTSEIQLIAWACDSVLTALTHQESKIAFRSLLQAAGYLARLGATGVFLGDSYQVARGRVEGLLFS